MGLALWAWLRPVDQIRSRDLWLGGVGLALAGAARPQVAPLVAVLLGWLAVRSRARAAIAPTAVVTLAAASHRDELLLVRPHPGRRIAARGRAPEHARGRGKRQRNAMGRRARPPSLTQPWAPGVQPDRAGRSRGDAAGPASTPPDLHFAGSQRGSDSVRRVRRVQRSGGADTRTARGTRWISSSRWRRRSRLGLARIWAEAGWGRVVAAWAAALVRRSRRRRRIRLSNEAWNTNPAEVDRAHHRLWEIRDAQVVRVFRSAPSPQNFRPVGRADGLVSRTELTILCFADTRFPIERANGLQTMATCHALASQGHDVTLVVRPDPPSPAREPFAFYDLPRVRRPAHRDGPALGRGARQSHPLSARRPQARGRSHGRDRLDARSRRGGVSPPAAVGAPAVVVYESHGVAPVVSEEMPRLLGNPELDADAA